MCNYQRHFVQHFGRIAEPLHRLTRAGATWSWGSEQQQAFERLKQALMTAPILAHPDTSLPFILETDASKGTGEQRSTIGAALLQEQGGRKRVIAYGAMFCRRRKQGAIGAR